MLPTKDLKSNTKSLNPSLKWVRSCMFLPWMNMGDKEGTLLFSAVGSKVERH
jgi:hypothetical protein